MRSASRFLSTRLLVWLAICIFVSISVLLWFVYAATSEWRRMATLLADRRAQQVAGLLAMAFSRDMRATESSVLLSVHWDAYLTEPPYDLTNIVAGAFARYPYPESFFAWRGRQTPDRFIYFTRSNRTPSWLSPDLSDNRFPVATGRDPGTASAILGRVSDDAIHGRPFSIFDSRFGGKDYQVVVRLIYSDPFRERLSGGFGFMVDLDWVRSHYFPDLARQVARIEDVGSGFSISVLDEKGRTVVGGIGPRRVLPSSTRRFPVLFFDPRVVALNQPPDLAQRYWTIRVNANDDPSLAGAVRGANRALILTTIAAGVLVLGFALTLGAAEARNRLAEARSDFVSAVTHELKTPLASIRAAADTIVGGRIATPVGMREYAGLVVQEVKRLTRLVDNLLAYARITDVTELYSFEPLDLTLLLGDVRREFDGQLLAGGFNVREELPPDLPTVVGDRTALTLLFGNLLDNAIRYSRKDAWLQIAARRVRHQITITISDRGMGIPEDEIDQVCNKFVRGRRAGSGGSGLGLAIVNRIVTGHRGSMHISSTVDVGTTVAVTLPIADSEDCDNEEADLDH